MSYISFYSNNVNNFNDLFLTDTVSFESTPADILLKVHAFCTLLKEEVMKRGVTLLTSLFSKFVWISTRTTSFYVKVHLLLIIFFYKSDDLVQHFWS